MQEIGICSVEFDPIILTAKMIFHAQCMYKQYLFKSPIQWVDLHKPVPFSILRI